MDCPKPHSCPLRNSVICVIQVLFFLIMYGLAIADENGPPDAASIPRRSFNEAEYDSAAVSKHTYQHGDVQITILQVKGFKDSATSEVKGYCRAWLDVRRGDELIEGKYYDDIFPLGSSYGLFVPRQQPTKNYFIVIKLGDYSGRLFLIDKQGKIIDALGGPFVVTADKKYIFSMYYSDDSGLTVLDLRHGTILYSSELTPYIQHWYESPLGYFFTESTWDNSKTGFPEEKRGVIYHFDFTTRMVVEQAIDVQAVPNAQLLRYDFVPQDYRDCISNQ